jgi:hypothetical protein
MVPDPIAERDPYGAWRVFQHRSGDRAEQKAFERATAVRPITNGSVPELRPHALIASAGFELKRRHRVGSYDVQHNQPGVKVGH